MHVNATWSGFKLIIRKILYRCLMAPYICDIIKPPWSILLMKIIPLQNTPNFGSKIMKKFALTTF